MDGDRNPVSGARIFIGNSNNTEHADNTTFGVTDSNGEFRVIKPDQPANFIVANHDEYAPGYTVYRDTLPTTGYEIFLQPQARVSGRTLLGDQPLADQRIEAYFLDAEAAGHWESKTDTLGRFAFEGLPPGTLSLQWNVADSDETTPEIFKNARATRDLKLAAGDDRVQDFVLPLQEGTVHCILDDSIPYGDTVIILDMQGSGQSLTATKERKNMREHSFENVPHGRYNALVIILGDSGISTYAEEVTVADGGESEVLFQRGNLGGIQGNIHTDSATLGMVFDARADMTPEEFIMNMVMLMELERIPDGFRGMILSLANPKDGVMPYDIDNLEDGQYAIGFVQDIKEPYTLSIEHAPYILEEFEIVNGETIEMNFEF